MSEVRRWLGTPDGALTVMFTDIARSSSMLLTLGERRWLQMLREHNRIVREQVRMHAGAEVKFLGDGFMVVFANPGDAVRCALGVQDAMPADVRVRIAVHSGLAVQEGADFIGPAVIVASRLVEKAEPGQILVSSVVRLASGGSGLRFSRGRRETLRGLGPHRVFEVRGRGARTPRAVAH